MKGGGGYNNFFFAAVECCLWMSPFLGTDVSPFPNFNNSVLTTRRNLLLHC